MLYITPKEKAFVMSLCITIIIVNV